MKTLLFAGAAAVALTGLAPALAQTAPPAAQPKAAKTVTRAEVAEHTQRMFARVDANRDGFITQAEADAAAATAHQRTGERRAARWGARFDRLDANKDGAISRAEFDAAHAKRAERMANRGGRGHRGGMAARLLARADADKDGRVSLAEATAAATARFDRIDANRDGQITPDERRAHRAARQNRAG